jgi:ATP-dependent DNA ligase
VSLDPAALFAFDAIAIDGRDLRALPLLERKAELAKLLRVADDSVLLVM